MSSNENNNGIGRGAGRRKDTPAINRNRSTGQRIR